MSDFSGSYRRFGANDSFPSSREHNKNLDNHLEDEVKLTRHFRNQARRKENVSEEAHEGFKSTDFGREDNKNVDNAFYGGEYAIAGGSLIGGSRIGGAFGKGTASKTHKGDLDFTTKRGDKDFHRGGHDEHSALSGGMLAGHRIGHFKVPKKHQLSMTREGRQDFVTHKGDKRFDRGGHYENNPARRRNRGVDMRTGGLTGGGFDVGDAILSALPFFL